MQTIGIKSDIKRMKTWEKALEFVASPDAFLFYVTDGSASAARHG